MICNPEVVRARGSAWALTYCQRWQLAESLPQGGSPSRAFLRALRGFDPGLELYFNPVRQKWILYRLLKRAPAPSEDVLLKEFEITGPHGEYRQPSWWLLDQLRRLDKTRGGTVDPHQADRAFLRRLDAEQDAAHHERDHAQTQQNYEAADALRKYAILGRKNFHVNRT